MILHTRIKKSSLKQASNIYDRLLIVLYKNFPSTTELSISKQSLAKAGDSNLMMEIKLCSLTIKRLPFHGDAIAHPVPAHDREMQ